MLRSLALRSCPVPIDLHARVVDRQLSVTVIGHSPTEQTLEIAAPAALTASEGPQATTALLLWKIPSGNRCRVRESAPMGCKADLRSIHPPAPRNTPTSTQGALSTITGDFEAVLDGSDDLRLSEE